MESEAMVFWQIFVAIVTAGNRLRPKNGKKLWILKLEYLLWSLSGTPLQLKLTMENFVTWTLYNLVESCNQPQVKLHW